MLVGVPIAYGKVRLGRRVLPECRAGHRPVVLIHARGNTIADREGSAGSRSRIAHPRHRRNCRRSIRGSAPASRATRTSPRTSSARSSSSSSTGRSAGRPAEIMDEARQRSADIPGIRVEVTAPAGRAADRQGDPGAAFQRLSRGAERSRPAGRRRTREISGNPRSRQRAADAGDRLAARGRQGRGGPLRRQRRLGRLDGPAGHQRHDGHRLPAGSPARTRSISSSACRRTGAR